MPYYLFENVNKKKETLLFFHMNDAPKIGSIITDEDGNQLKRLATKPNAAIDSIEGCPFDKNNFIKATNKKGETFGSMWDKSKEFSERRKEKDGIDYVEQNYNKKREEQTGIPTKSEKTKKAEEKLKKLGVKINAKEKKR